MIKQRGTINRTDDRQGRRMKAVAAHTGEEATNQSLTHHRLAPLRRENRAVIERGAHKKLSLSSEEDKIPPLVIVHEGIGSF